MLLSLNFNQKGQNHFQTISEFSWTSRDFDSIRKPLTLFRGWFASTWAGPGGYATLTSRGSRASRHSASCPLSPINHRRASPKQPQRCPGGRTLGPSPPQLSKHCHKMSKPADTAHTKTKGSAPLSRVRNALALPPKWLATYDDFVSKNIRQVSQMESALQSLTYIIPGELTIRPAITFARSLPPSPQRNPSFLMLTK